MVLEDLVVAYERRPAVHHLSGDFPAASLTAIVGPNGGGKSTLLKALAGVQPVSSGRLDRDGLRRRDIAYLAQHEEGCLDRVCAEQLEQIVEAQLHAALEVSIRASRRSATEDSRVVVLLDVDAERVGNHDDDCPFAGSGPPARTHSQIARQSRVESQWCTGMVRK